MNSGKREATPVQRFATRLLGTAVYLVYFANAVSPAVGQNPTRSRTPATLEASRLPATRVQQAITWDFETGNLAGWTKTGKAFDAQPTKDDNPLARARGQSANHQGSYWIGTFEQYQGLSGQERGQAQGDRPQGTLSSTTFTVRPGSLSFLVGGGAGFETRVVLLIRDPIEGSIRVAHASGQNRETMRRVTWDLSPYAGKQAYVQIVDESSGPWGHINADDFLFSGTEEPRRPERVSVPDVRGRSLEVAREMLKESGFGTGSINEEASDRGTGLVIDQRPNPSAVVESPGPVDLVVSTGPSGPEVSRVEPRSAPAGTEMVVRVVGSGFNRFSRIAIDGFVASDGTKFINTTALEVRLRVPESAPPGSRDVVHRWEPRMVRAGELPGQTAVLEGGFSVLPRQPTEIAVPDLRGRSLDAAREILKQSGLEPGSINEGPSDRAKAGTVIDQRPSPSAIVEPPGPVDLLVSSGPAPVEIGRIDPATASAGTELVARVVGSGFTRFSRIAIDEFVASDGTKFINTTALEVRLRVPESAPPGSRDVVHRWEPRMVRAGELPGQTAVLEGGFSVLPRQPTEIEVPDLRGRSLDAAQEILKESRLEPGSINEGPSDQARAGTVIDQRPSPGALVEPPGPVDLLVSSGPAPVEIGRIDPSTATAGSELLARVVGSGFTRFSRISIDDFVPADGTTFIGTKELEVRMRIPNGAVPGDRDVAHFWDPEMVEAGALPGQAAVLDAGFRVLARQMEEIIVPDLTGMPLREAEEIVVERGLSIGEVMRLPSESLTGTVVRQNPTAGASLTAPEPIDLWISDATDPQEPRPADLVLGVPDITVLAEEGVGQIEIDVGNEGFTEAPRIDIVAEAIAGGVRWRDTKRLASLAPGGRTRVSFSVPLQEATPGKPVTIRIHVDPDDSIPELLESNNRRTATLRMPGAPAPDEPTLPWMTILIAALAITGAAVLVWALRSFSLAGGRDLPRSGQKSAGEGAPAESKKASAEMPAEKSADSGIEISEDERKAGLAGAVGTGQAEPVHFTAFHPKEVYADEWATLLVYVHVEGAFKQVEADSEARLAREDVVFASKAGQATQTVARETKIDVVPELPGFRFNPERRDFLWLEDWHCADFRMLPDSEAAGLEIGMPVTGRVGFYVGPILIGEVKIWTVVTEPRGEAGAARTIATPGAVSGKPFRAIFPSYSHKDAEIVSRFKKVYEAVGDRLLQDIVVLRSGEKWNDAILEKIDEADVFQLYWSETARASRYVEQEWRHALQRDLPYFIRPLYWQKPMPPPPPELAALHFALMEFDR